MARSDWWDAGSGRLPGKVTSKSPAMRGAQQAECTARAKELGWDRAQGIGGTKGRSPA